MHTSHELEKHIAQKLIALRYEKNYSQHAVAQDLHISDSTMSKIEHGIYKLDMQLISKFADYYNKPVSYFLPAPPNT